MKTTLTLLITFLSLSAICQELNIPTKDGKIFYEKIDSVPGMNKAQLHSQLKVWFVNSFTSAKSVIQSDEPENGHILGKGIFNIHSTGLGTATWPCNFTIAVFIKDNKYKIQLYNFTYGEADISMESVLSMYEKGKQKKSTGNMLTEMHDTSMKILTSVSASVRKNNNEF